MNGKSYKDLRHTHTHTYLSALEAFAFKMSVTTMPQGKYDHYNEQLLEKMLILTNSECQGVVLNYRITRKQFCNHSQGDRGSDVPLKLLKKNVWHG